MARLAFARKHVKEAGERIHDQVLLIEELKAGGHDTSMTEDLLTHHVPLHPASVHAAL
ncbi:hypothetical protein QA644_06695 [Rhizobium sp. CC1099]|uniref:hypothetical protein n=1 Tax=Rhizobium sp. CC1099 TaxID=3039160 RepID=UPI0024B13CEC|nr:hypothetical protein [Rhizobium sp. CC1099]WFU88746.1 hypothetical protein QA644_06695 [Rhizobium sp. CC1099]